MPPVYFGMWLLQQMTPTKEEKLQYRSGREAAVADAYSSVRGIGLTVER